MSRPRLEYLPNYTYNDYVNWEGKWELINGIPYAMTPVPNILHQKVSGKIHIQLERSLQNCKTCQAFLPIDWRIPNKEDNIVLQPDNLVICKNVEGNYLTDTPVMIFEILSPATALKDRHTKYDIYETQGVKYYIIVDIDLKSADVFELKDKEYYKKAEVKMDVVKFELCEDCVINFNFEKIWSN